MLLPDPRKEVIIRRILSDKQVSLLFPGNIRAKEVNEELRKQLQIQQAKGKAKKKDSPMQEMEEILAADDEGMGTMEKFSGDTFQRNRAYTPPRTITLETKYDGAVSLSIWTGYAIMVVGKTGERKVVVGPQNLSIRI